MFRSFAASVLAPLSHSGNQNQWLALWHCRIGVCNTQQPRDEVFHLEWWVILDMGVPVLFHHTFEKQEYGVCVQWFDLIHLCAGSWPVGCVESQPRERLRPRNINTSLCDATRLMLL